MDKATLKKDLEIIKSNAQTALEHLEKADLDGLQETSRKALTNHIANAKIKTFQIGGMLYLLREEEASQDG